MRPRSTTYRIRLDRLAVAKRMSCQTDKRARHLRSRWPGVQTTLGIRTKYARSGPTISVVRTSALASTFGPPRLRLRSDSLGLDCSLLVMHHHATLKHHRLTFLRNVLVHERQVLATLDTRCFALGLRGPRDAHEPTSTLVLNIAHFLKPRIFPNAMSAISCETKLMKK